MYITIYPYTMKSKAAILVSLVATAIGVFLLIKSIYVLSVLWLCWLLPLCFYITGVGHENRSVKIDEDEIKCLNSARESDSQWAFGGFLSSLTLNRSDIIGFDTYFHANVVNPVVSTDNLKITTVDKKDYIIDGRIIDIKVVKLALEGNYAEANALVKKRNDRNQRIAVICNAVACTFTLVVGFVICSFVG